MIPEWLWEVIVSVLVLTILGMAVWRHYSQLRLNQALSEEIASRREMENSLRASEEKFRIVAENTYDWEFWLSPDDRFIYNSHSCERITGYSVEEFERDSSLFSRILHPEEVEHFLGHRHEQKELTQPEDLEFRIIRKDGSVRWVSHVCQPVFDSTGTFLGTRGNNRDITFRKAVEISSRENEERFKVIFEASNEAILICEIATGAILEGNSRMLSMFGCFPEEIRNICFADLSSGIPPYSRDEAARWMEKAKAGKDLAFEWQTKHRSGRLFWVETHMKVVTIGHEERLLVTAIDITEKKQSSDEFKKLAEVLEMRVKERTAELSRKSDELMDSQRALMNLVEDLNQKSEELSRANIALKSEIEIRKQAQDDILRLNQDLLHQKSFLETINRELETFSYSVSHDLRAPLRAIDGFSLAILEDYGGILKEDGRDYLNRMRKATQKMAHLIDDILNLSRLTRSELTIQDIDLSEMVESISADLRQDQPGKSVCMKIRPGILVRGDPRLMKIAMENLLNNAFKFTSLNPAPEIEFGVVSTDSGQTIFLKDNGVGFDMALADKMFYPFQRFHTAEEFPGTGIGLATVQRIIHRHHGKIWAESGKNKGTTFYLSFL